MEVPFPEARFNVGLNHEQVLNYVRYCLLSLPSPAPVRITKTEYQVAQTPWPMFKDCIRRSCYYARCGEFKLTAKNTSQDVEVLSCDWIRPKLCPFPGCPILWLSVGDKLDVMIEVDDTQEQSPAIRVGQTDEGDIIFQAFDTNAALCGALRRAAGQLKALAETVRRNGPLDPFPAQLLVIFVENNVLRYRRDPPAYKVTDDFLAEVDFYETYFSGLAERGDLQARRII